MQVRREEIATENAARQKAGLLGRARNFLFGNDVFISYSRSDAAAYALLLARELTGKKLICFLDQWGTPPGDTLPPELKTALDRSSMLVLVGTKGAAKSIHVRSEVEEYLKTRRPVVPITFDGSLQEASWFPSVRGIALTVEKIEALEGGVPGAHVITRVVDSSEFFRRDKRLRRVFWFTAVGIVAIVLAGVAVSWKLRADVQEQQKISAAGRLSGQALNHQAGQPDLSLLLALESYKIARAIGPDSSAEAGSTLFELLLRNPNLNSFLHGNKAEGMSLAFSQDGRKVASGNSDGTVTVWSVSDRKQLPSPTGNLSTVESLAFSRDGNLLACGTADGSISIWDERSGLWLKKIERDAIASPGAGVSGAITALAFGPDGNTLAIGRCGRRDGCEGSAGRGDSPGAEILFFNLAGAKPEVTFLPNSHTSAPSSLAYSPGGETLVSSSEESIVFRDSATHRVIRRVASQGNVRVMGVTFGRDNRVIASGVRRADVVVWDVNSGEELVQPLRGHQGAVTSVAPSPDGLTVASAGDDRKVILWEMGSYGPSRVFLRDTRTDTVAVSPDGRFLATGDEGAVNVWDTAGNGLHMGPLEGHALIVRGMAFSADSKLMASPAKGGGIHLWSLETKQQVTPTLNGNHGRVWQVAFGPDGKTLASANDDGTVSLWDVASRRESIPPLKLKARGAETPAPVYFVAFSPDGKLLAAGTQQGEVVLWDMINSRQAVLPPVGRSETAMGLAFSPDGSKLAAAFSGEFENNITLWDVPSRALIRPSLTANDDFGGGVVFSDDSSLIAWVDIRGTVKLWDVRSARLFVRIPPGASGLGRSIAFTTEGRLVTYEHGGAILFWDMDVASWVSRACGIANRSLTPEERLDYALEPRDGGVCKES